MSPAKRYIVAPQGGGPPLLITSNSPLVSGEVGLAYSQTLQGTGGAPPYFWSLISGFFPTGLSLSVGGVVSGTPTATGSSTVVLQIMDSRGARSPVKSFGITIVAAVSITTSTPLPAASQGIVYNQAIAATGGVTPYTWSIASQTGTNTWSIGSSSGILTGTPANAETDSITVEVMDALGGISTKVFSLTVQATAATPTFSPIGGTYAGAQTVTISCSTPSSSIFYTTDGTAPTTGSTPYTTPITVSVSETVKAIATASGFAQSAIGSATYTITAGSSLAISTSSLPNATVNGSYFYQMAATGGQPPYQWGQVGANLFGGFNYSVNVVVSSATQTANAVFTLSSSASTHPFAGQTQCMVYPVVGSWKAAYYQSGAITSLGGSSGAWTVTTNMNFSNSSYGSQITPCALVAGPTGANPYQCTLTGMLEVVPTVAETANLPFIVTDNIGSTATVTLPITVNSTLAIMGCSLDQATQLLPQAMQYNAYQHQFLAAGGTGSGQSWTASGLPSGLSMSTGGLLSGIPTGTDSSDFITVTVVDSGPNTASYVFNLVVVANANVARPSYNTGTSWFTVGGKLYDPNGAPFRIRGFNQAHYDSSSTTLLPKLGTNAVRIFNYLTNSQGGWPPSVYTPVVANTAAAGMMPVFSFNQTPGFGIANATITGTGGQFSCPATSLPILVGGGVNVSGTLTGTGTITGYTGNNNYLIGATNGSTTFTLVTTSNGAITTTAGTGTGLLFAGMGQSSSNSNPVDIQTIGNWIAQNYAAFNANTVWNIANEWNGTTANWVTAYEGAVSTIRSAGCTQLLMIDANGSGQNYQTLVNNSAAVLNSDPQKNIVFSFHAYGATQNIQAQISSITRGSSNTVVGINFTGPVNPFANYSIGDNVNGTPPIFITGVGGMTQINGYTSPSNASSGGTSGAYTITFPLNSSGYSAYTSGGTIYASVHISQIIAPALAALASSGVCCVIGEMGPGKWIGTNDGSPTSCTNAQVIAAAEANNLGWMVWAIDDNNLGSNSTGPNWYGSLLVNGTYSNATSLTYTGLDYALNPDTGVYGLATPASYYVGGSNIPSLTFKYFVSTTGSDSNNGLTPATAWAFTSFQNTSPNNALMASQKVGIIAGTYSTAGLTSSNPNDFTASLINIPGGTSSAPTYIASCNSSGVYTPRVAIISVAGAPTTQNAIMGGPNGQVSGKSSYITIDGITINGNNLAYNSGGTNTVHLIQMYGVYSPSTSSNASETGIIIQNCELYGILTTTHPGGNAALIFFEGVHSSLVQNNYLHDASSTFATDLGHVHAGEEYGCYNNQWVYNTIANCCSAFDAKNSDTGTICAYNYIFNVGAPIGNTASALAFEGFDGYAAGATTTGPAPINYVLHHNVLDGCCGVSIGDQTFFTLIPINIYNNTVYDTSTGSNLGWHHNTNGASNLLTFYNNIYVATVGTGGGSSSAKLTTGSAAGNALLDYNCYYQGSGTYTNFWSNFSTAESSLANWKTLMGQEAHSFTGNPTFASTYTAGNGPVQFKLGSGSPCAGTGQSGDNVGAWDAGTTQIGAAWCLTSGTYPITANSNNGSGA